jgi:hypothetical protein
VGDGFRPGWGVAGVAGSPGCLAVVVVASSSRSGLVVAPAFGNPGDQEVAGAAPGGEAGRGHEVRTGHCFGRCQQADPIR